MFTVKAKIKKLCHIFLELFPKKKIILFESRPDFSCNTYPVYLSLSQNPKLKKFKFVWVIHGDKILENINFISDNQKGFMRKLKKLYLFERACCFVSCNGIFSKCSPKQISIFLSHGSKTKKTRGICEIGDAADFVMVQSHFFDDIIKYEYDLKQEQLAYCGYPRCDYFYNCKKDISSYFDMKDGSRYIIWLPTFRKNVYRAVDDAESSYNNIGMPIIYSVEQLKKLNDFLLKRNLYIIYKPHPSQDISVLKATTMTNIFVLNDDILFDKNLQLYEVIAKSSALITDYSSVYFDYLLLNKPIATTCDDADEWKQGRGFAFDLEAFYDKSTVRVKEFEALISFIDCVHNNFDEKQEEREKITDLTNMYRDGNSAKRVADFIVNKLQEKKYL